MIILWHNLFNFLWSWVTVVIIYNLKKKILLYNEVLYIKVKVVDYFITSSVFQINWYFVNLQFYICLVALKLISLFKIPLFPWL